MARPRQDPELDREAVGVIVRFFEAFNDRDFQTMMSLIDEEKFVNHTYWGHGPVKPEAVGRAIAGMIETFPDWHETIDEITPTADGQILVRQTGRGTQAKEYLGVQPTGEQIAETLLTVLRVENGKITEYRSTYPFTRPWDEQITAAEDLQERRAEQGGLRISQGDWRAVLRDYADGTIDTDTLATRKAEVPEEQARCQALLATNMKRCQNAALPGSLYCEIHQGPGEGGSFAASVS